MKLTDKTMQRAATAAPQWLVDDASLPAGSLVFYIGAKPARGEVTRSFYYRWRHGGQRPEQLLRVTAADIDLDDGIIQLHDAKGRRQQPRLHVLPVTPLADEVIRDLRARHPSEHYLFIAQRNVRMRPESLSRVATEIAARMVAAGTVTRRRSSAPPA